MNNSLTKNDILCHVANELIANRVSVATGESCTGGLLSSVLTDIPGSSAYFLGGVTSYSNEAKITLLGVDTKTIEEYGAVSKETALEMVKGIEKIFRSDISVAVTGIAGPGGSTSVKPVGLVFISFASKGSYVVKEFNFVGNRSEIKEQTVRAALIGIKEILTGTS